MKLLIVAVCVLATSVLAAPQGNPFDAAVTIVRYFYENNGLDGYRFTSVAKGFKDHIVLSVYQALKETKDQCKSDQN